MSTKNEAQKSGNGLDKVKWGLVFILLAISIWGNYHFSQASYGIAPILRISAVVTVILLAVVLALTTAKGKATISFAKESRLEMRKVIWPTRKEATHTTLLVAAVTAVMSLILWGLDSVMIQLIAFATSLGV